MSDVENGTVIKPVVRRERTSLKPIGKKKVKLRTGPKRIYSSIRARDDARNIRRNKRRKNDREYRIRLLVQARDNRRLKTGETDCRHIVIDDVDALSKIGGTGVVIKGLNRGEEITFFDTNQVAEVLGGRSRQTVYRWLDTGLLPPMVNQVKGEVINERGTYKRLKVYTLNEMTIISRILRTHQKNRSCRFGVRYKKVVEMISKSVKKERKSK